MNGTETESKSFAPRFALSGEFGECGEEANSQWRMPLKMLNCWNTLHRNVAQSTTKTATNMLAKK